MEYTYGNNKSQATITSPISLQDALVVVNYGKQLLNCFDEHGVQTGTDCPPPTNEVFSSFHEALYGAGFVAGDFDGPLFDSGPMRLLFIPGVAALVAKSSNLATVRMFTHTLARGYRATFGYGGYPYFDRAYTSGGLRSLLERIDQYCHLAQRQGWRHLEDDPELDLVISQPEVPKSFELHSEEGFLGHCKVVALLLEHLEINPHTKHHIREAIREASYKVTPYPGKGKSTAPYRSLAASEQINAGETTELVLEHAVPVSYINEMIFREELTSEHEIAKLIYDWTILSVITQAEHKILLNKGLGKAMPANWDGIDKFARYKECGIEVQLRETKRVISHNGLDLTDPESEPLSVNPA